MRQLVDEGITQVLPRVLRQQNGWPANAVQAWTRQEGRTKDPREPQSHSPGQLVAQRLGLGLGRDRRPSQASPTAVADQQPHGEDRRTQQPRRKYDQGHRGDPIRARSPTRPVRWCCPGTEDARRLHGHGRDDPAIKRARDRAGAGPSDGANRSGPRSTTSIWSSAAPRGHADHQCGESDRGDRHGRDGTHQDGNEHRAIDGRLDGWPSPLQEPAGQQAHGQEHGRLDSNQVKISSIGATEPAVSSFDVITAPPLVLWRIEGLGDLPSIGPLAVPQNLHDPELHPPELRFTHRPPLPN